MLLINGQSQLINYALQTYTRYAGLPERAAVWATVHWSLGLLAWSLGSVDFNYAVLRYWNNCMFHSHHFGKPSSSCLPNALGKLIKSGRVSSVLKKLNPCPSAAKITYFPSSGGKWGWLRKKEITTPQHESDHTNDRQKKRRKVKRRRVVE